VRATTACTLTCVAVLGLAACDRGATDAPPAPPKLEEPATTAAGPSADEIVAAHRPHIARVFAADDDCVNADCFARRAAEVSAAVTPFDEELGESEAADAKVMRTTTSALLHASLELRSCVELSARKQDRVPQLDECRGPLQQFGEAMRRVRAEFGA
jgi:hypothetical protein